MFIFGPKSSFSITFFPIWSRLFRMGCFLPPARGREATNPRLLTEGLSRSPPFSYPLPHPHTITHYMVWGHGRGKRGGPLPRPPRNPPGGLPHLAHMGRRGAFI